MVSPAFDPKEPRYWEPDDLLAEERRQFDVCHGCRLCWNLCPTFPALFELTDSVEGDLSKVGREELDHVEELCFQCKLCWVVCPYTEPHDLAMDVPRLLTRAKAIHAKEKSIPLAQKMIADQDMVRFRFAIMRGPKGKRARVLDTRLIFCGQSVSTPKGVFEGSFKLDPVFYDTGCKVQVYQGSSSKRLDGGEYRIDPRKGDLVEMILLVD